jgi:hypothetical protein
LFWGSQCFDEERISAGENYCSTGFLETTNLALGIERVAVASVAIDNYGPLQSISNVRERFCTSVKVVSSILDRPNKEQAMDAPDKYNAPKFSSVVVLTVLTVCPSIFMSTVVVRKFLLDKP